MKEPWKLDRTRHWVIGCIVITLLGYAVDAGAYEVDFHYYVVYLILRARNYPPATADQLAGFSQFVDDNSATEPLYTFSANRGRFHFAGSGPEVATVANVQDARDQVSRAFAEYAAGQANGKYLVGAALHLMADTFSHATFTAWWDRRINRRLGSWRGYFGHADTEEAGHAPDRPYNQVKTALAAASAIYALVPPVPGGATVPWSTIDAQLAPVFASQTPTVPSLSVRIQKIRDVLKRQFEDARYTKAKFAC